MSEPFIGEIRMFGFNFAPRSWAVCAGQLMPINQNPSLFALINTYYGGDGRSTMGLPDLRGRAAISMGQGPGLQSYGLGQRGGKEINQLSVGQMPAHSHTAEPTLTSHQPATGAAADLPTPNGNVPGQLTDGRTPQNIYSATSDNSTLKEGSVDGTIAIGDSGSGQAVENRMPYLTMNYCIALEGLFPSRN